MFGIEDELKRIEMVIEKPNLNMNGIGAESGGSATEDTRHVDEHGSPPVLITDFILRFPEYPKKRRDNIIIETMGFRWKSNRLEKAEIIPLMEAELGNISHVKHDFHFPSDLNQS